MIGWVRLRNAAMPAGLLIVAFLPSSETNEPPSASTIGTYEYHWSTFQARPYTATLSLSKPASSPRLPLTSTVIRLYICSNSAQVQPFGVADGLKSRGGVTPASLAILRLT